MDKRRYGECNRYGQENEKYQGSSKTLQNSLYYTEVSYQWEGEWRTWKRSSNSTDEEREIVEACVIFAEWGFGLGRREVEGIIQNYLLTTKKKHPFKNGVPGEGWWSGFMKQHPELRHKKPQHLQMFRAKATNQEVINHWFIECLKPVLEKLSLLNSPEQIYNVDESGFPLSWTPKIILTRKGHKTPQALIAGSGRENITVQT